MHLANKQANDRHGVLLYAMVRMSDTLRAPQIQTHV